MPNKLIWRATKAYARRDTSLLLTITEEDSAFWYLLDEPDSAGEPERDESFEWKRKLEGDFVDSHRNAREPFQKLFEEKPDDRPRSLSALVRHFADPKNPVLYRMTRKMYKQLTGRSLSHFEFVNLMQARPEWPLYFAGWGHEMFARAIRPQKFGIKGKPGTLDLWCANYLPYCDVFVTNDNGQYKSLRVLNTFVKPMASKPVRAKVLLYQRWRHILLT